jgi:hypothetical protein
MSKEKGMRLFSKVAVLPCCRVGDILAITNRRLRGRVLTRFRQ